MPETLVLTRRDLRVVVDVGELVSELESAMLSYTEGGPGRRVRSHPSDSVTAMILAPGLATGVPAYTVKVHAKNPDRRPALTGVICLHDLHTGDLLAVLDSGWLTTVRTAAGAVLGTLTLANPHASTVAVIGAGEQGRAQVLALAAARPLTAVHVYDPDHRAADAVAALMTAHRIAVHIHASAASAAAHSDIILTATWARTPLLRRDDVPPGTHVTSLGADEPGKSELHEDLLHAALVVTDDQELAAPVLPEVDTTLARVLRNEHPGRQDQSQITVYSPVGLPLQDAVAAWHAYRRAREQGIGSRLDLEQ